MKLTKIDSYEIQAFAFRVMTGYVAPGKDASPLADEASYEERCAAFDEWRNEHAPCILAMLHGFEALIDRNDEPTRALLDDLDRLRAELAAAREDGDKLKRFSGAMLRLGREEFIGDIDGVDLQDAAVSAGLLQEVTATEPCAEWCRCADDGDFPLTCYRLTALGDAAMDSAIDAARGAK